VAKLARRSISLGLAALVCGAGASGPSPLIDAARRGNNAALRDLLQKKVDVNAAAADGATALHWASYHDDLPAADLLLAAGADVNAANDLGVTPLWTASQNGSAAMVEKLFAAGANPNAPLLSGETPLMVGARSGHPEVVRLLLANKADVNARGFRAQTALMWAAAQKHPAVVKLLLAHGANVHARSEVWSQVMAVPPHGYPDYNRSIPHGGYTALLFAARAGDLESAKLLVAAGAPVNDQDAWGVTATVLAAHSGYYDLVQFLLAKGAGPNLEPAGFTALHAAIMRRDEKMASVLLAHGANANAPLRTWTPTRRGSQDFHFEPALVGATPFWLAARFIHPGIMRLLVKHGADPLFVHRSQYVTAERFQQRTEMTTAIMAAAGMGGGKAWMQPPQKEREMLTLEAVKLAAELGVDVDYANTDGRTALDAAKALRYESVVRFLIEKGARSHR
jgi:ankyrin repeat protein